MILILQHQLSVTNSVNLSTFNCWKMFLVFIPDLAFLYPRPRLLFCLICSLGWHSKYTENPGDSNQSAKLSNLASPLTLATL